MSGGLSIEVNRLLATMSADERRGNRRLQASVRRLFSLLYGPWTDDWALFIEWREGFQ